MSVMMMIDDTLISRGPMRERIAKQLLLQSRGGGGGGGNELQKSFTKIVLPNDSNVGRLTD